MKKYLFIFLIGCASLSSCGDEADSKGATDSSGDIAAADVQSVKANDDTLSSSPMKQTTDLPSLFYWNYDANKGMQAPEVVTVDEAVKIMDELPSSDGNMLGMIRGEDDIVQFMYQDGRGLVLDIPNVAEPVDKAVTKEQALKIIRDFYSGKHDDDIAHAY